MNNTDILEKFKAIAQQTQESPNIFPAEVFPPHIQEIITATNESLRYPIDFMGASILYAASVAIGNTYRVSIKNGWSENAVLYMAIIGNTGTVKSHPLSFALKPIEKKDAFNYSKYKREKREYDAILNLPKKERENQSEPVKPVWEQFLVTDFTPEALAEVHKFNSRGIGVYSDELASWFKNFNRYNKGSEEQFWLSNWSGKTLRVNRKTSEPIYIPLPFISVAGTIQPAVLNELAKNRTENGFTDRLLFVFPDNLKKEYWSDKELDPDILENWNIIINNLINLPLRTNEDIIPEPEILHFSHEAKTRLWDWQKTITDLSNGTEDKSLKGIYAKMEMHTIRLALILELLKDACGGSSREISLESVNGALKLTDYFTQSAIKVSDYINKQPEKKNLAVLLAKQGKSYGEISQIIYGDDTHKSNVYRWITGKK